MYKEFSVFLLLVTFVLIPTNAFAWNQDDDQKAHSEPKKDNTDTSITTYLIISDYVEVILIHSEDELVDTNLLYEPHSKWIDDK